MVVLLLATRNAHKAAEIQSILGEKFRCLSLNQFPAAPLVIEDAGTFAGNATKKSAELARWLSASCMTSAACVLADDSGLEVDALHGAPGVHSARFAAMDPGTAGNPPDAENNAKLLRLLENVPLEERTARFRCVLALTPVLAPREQDASPACYADEFELATELFEGICEGRIGFAPRGRGGFGYDPLFIPLSRRETFAELGEEVKNQLSHRGQALTKLKRRLELTLP